MSFLRELFKKKNNTLVFPLLYTPDSVLFPDTILSLSVSSKYCINALQEALHRDRLIVVVLLKKIPEQGDTELEFHEVGTLATVLQVSPGIDGSQRLLLEGKERVKILKTRINNDFYETVLDGLSGTTHAIIAENKELSALVKIAKQEFRHYAEQLKKIPFETLNAVEKADSAEEICNIIGHFLPITHERKQEILALDDDYKRIEFVIKILSQENELNEIQQKIEQKVKMRISKAQKDYYLQEKLREIKKELGKENDAQNEYEELEQQILQKQPPQEIVARIKKEIRRLSRLPPLSPEAVVLRTYIEVFGELPWTIKSNDVPSIEEAKKILDNDHYGMQKVKERILEFIAVQQLSQSCRGPILCFIGPPGTGKTSLGKSIARALGREFVRISLGGLRDEAEIRGHRRTYVGALPGKIIQGMRHTVSIDPVFLLDEIDKMSSDFRGDPASALLEVLDPEQNHAFTDHYLEAPYDLSHVVFITTANSLHGIPYPLLDRMEIIEIPSYTDYEKCIIAENFIIPKQLAENGLASLELTWSKQAIKKIIHDYTMEAGVRSLEREIAHVIRKLALDLVEKHKAITEIKKTITEKDIEKYLGRKKYDPDLVFSDTIPGLVYGLAWTELGGSILPVEVTSFPGETELILTGNLGDVMKESARTALTYIRAHQEVLSIPKSVFEHKTIHIHVPEGAIPKDGPSAGITLAVAMLSAFLGTPVEQGWAMTGEITLTGRILPVGGIKEKLLAAHRNKCTKILLPEKNHKDLEDIPKEVLSELTIKEINSVLDAFTLLFPSIKVSEKNKKAKSIKKKA
ncbi:MAG TPA: endopeptidase La [Spirochaetales bacterium]|nr:endopeptidase La [Spirochaetales bacterium]HQK34804.1 endopeptidase La [Spirochaetales bacterium]